MNHTLARLGLDQLNFFNLKFPIYISNSGSNDIEERSGIEDYKTTPSRIAKCPIARLRSSEKAIFERKAGLENINLSKDYASLRCPEVEQLPNTNIDFAVSKIIYYI